MRAVLSGLRQQDSASVQGEGPEPRVSGGTIHQDSSGFTELVALLNTLTTDLEPIENLRKDLSDVVSELNSALSEVDEVAKSLRMSAIRIRSEVDKVKEAAFQRVPEARLPKPQKASELLSRISAAEQDLLRQHFLTQGALALSLSAA